MYKDTGIQGIDAANKEIEINQSNRNQADNVIHGINLIILALV